MFDVTEQADADTLVLHATGELDVATVQDLRGRFETAATSPVSTVVVDLTDVTFLDSSGLGVLVEGHRALEQAGKALVVRASTPAVLKVFEVTGMDRYLTLERPA